MIFNVYSISLNRSKENHEKQALLLLITDYQIYQPNADSIAFTDNTRLLWRKWLTIKRRAVFTIVVNNREPIAFAE